MAKQTFKIINPHAAVKIWNYTDRIGLEGVSNINGIDEVILSTVSCKSIRTTRAKGSPVGTFEIVLAPTKNWVAEITAGSWCVILMSNQPITQDALTTADSSYVKMIGKIETVRADVNIDDDGARHTSYIVSGSDWGYIFNTVLYIDNLIAAANDPINQGNAISVILQRYLTSDGGAPQSFQVTNNLRNLLGIFGFNPDAITETKDDINRLGKSVYDFLIPTEMARFFQFVDPTGDVNTSTKLSDLIRIVDGKLTGSDTYTATNEAAGFLDSFSLQGTNTFWQILLDNSNPTLNEMYNELRWTENGPALTLYNRIKPFSFRSPSAYQKIIGQSVTSAQGSSVSSQVTSLRSPFKYVKTHTLDPVTVMSVNVGTNWRDKYNFIEIRPQDSSFAVLGNWSAQKSQGFQPKAFNREGFRPLIVGTKQLPGPPGEPNFDLLTAWVQLMKEWYFDTHKLLNGTIVLRGTTEYIPVGDNIRFEAELLTPTHNINTGNVKSNSTNYILAHVENVDNQFTVSDDGGRTYVTTIQFVRGVVVTQDNELVGQGSLDELTSDMLGSYKNSVNVFGSSDPVDPDPQKLHGD